MLKESPMIKKSKTQEISNDAHLASQANRLGSEKNHSITILAPKKGNNRKCSQKNKSTTKNELETWERKKDKNHQNRNTQLKKSNKLR